MQEQQKQDQRQVWQQLWRRRQQRLLGQRTNARGRRYCWVGALLCLRMALCAGQVQSRQQQQLLGPQQHQVMPLVVPPQQM
jgi:hypothetical protein